MENPGTDYIGTQVALVSATITDRVQEFADTYLTSRYLHLKPGVEDMSSTQARLRKFSASLPSGIQHYYFITDEARMNVLPELCEAIRRSRSSRHSTVPWSQCILVFFNDWEPAVIRELAFRLRKRFKVGSISHYTSRAESRDALKDDVEIILCDDLLSRGMDLSRVSHIINFNIPLKENVYIHRAGRTCRPSNLFNSTSSVITLVPRHGPKREALEKIAENLRIKIKQIRIKDDRLHYPEPTSKSQSSHLPSPSSSEVEVIDDPDVVKVKQRKSVIRSAKVEVYY